MTYSIIHTPSTRTVAVGLSLRRAMRWIARHEDGPRRRTGKHKGWLFEFRAD